MIDLTVTIDNEQAKKKFEELKRTSKQTMSSIVTDAERMDAAMRFRPQIDKRAAKEVEAVFRELAETMPLSVGAAYQKTEREIKSFVSKLQKEVQLAQIGSLMSQTPSANPLSGMEEVLTRLPEKADKAAGSMGSLNFATQQLVREVPAATMGLHMFFLAISNNLPYFADAIKQVREENKALAASGKPTTSVFKQIISSLFSWQTALIAGVTALTLYGKEIGSWIKGLFKGKEALDAVAQAEKTLADVRRQATLDAQEEIVQMQLAVKAMQDNNRSMAERKRAMRTLQDQYPEYFGKLREEQMLYGDIGDSVDVLIKKMVALATARKSFDKLVENEQKLKLLEGTQGYDEFTTTNAAFEGIGRKKIAKQVISGFDIIDVETPEYLAYNKARKNFLDNLEEGGKEAEALFKEISDKYDGNVGAYIKAINESNKKLTNEASALITTPDLTEERSNAEEAKAEQQRRNEEAAAALKRAAEERKRTIEQLNNDLAKDVERTQRQRDDAEIAAIADGAERKRREIMRDYDRRVAEIDKYEQDLMDAQDGELTPEQNSYIRLMRRYNTDTLMAGKVLVKAMRQEAAEEAVAMMDDYLIEYGTFQEQLLAVQSKYNRLIAETETEGERMALEAERDAILAEYEVQASEFATSLLDMTTAQLSTLLSELQAQVDAKEAAFKALDSSNTASAKQYREEINKLKAQIKVLQEQLGKANKAIDGDNWAEAAEGMEVFDEGFAKGLRTMANVAGATTNLLSGIQMLVAGSTAATAAIRAMETASVILAVIAAAIQLVSALVSAFSNKEMKETINKFKELNAEIAQLNKLAKIDSWKDTIFGENAFGNFANNISVMQEALKALEASKKAIADRKFLEKIYVGIDIDTGEGIAQWIERSYKDFDKSFRNMKVKLKDYGKFAEWLGFVDKETTLEKQLPSIFEDDEVTLEELKKLQESDVWDKLSQENRELIDQMINDWEYYEQAVKAVNDYLSDIFGDFGVTMADILVDSFNEGTDAVKAFGDAASDIIERLTKDFIYSTFIKDFVDEAEEDIAALNDKELSSEERVKGLVDILRTLESNVTGAQDEVNAALAELEAAGYGYDGSTSGQTSTSKGFQAMSQDTGDELNGRFTDIQGKVSGIHEAVQFMKSLSTQQLQHVSSIDTTVAMIHNDTTLIERHTRVLRDMDDKLERIVRNTEVL